MSRSKTLSALIFVLAFGLLGCGVKMTAAGIASYQAEAFLSAWGKSGSEPEVKAWQIAQAAAERAVGLYPVASGDYLDRLGRVYGWLHFRQPFGDAQAEASRRAALAAYQASMDARPAWPFTQARLLRSKLYLLQFDDEFARALVQAEALGPWRIEINRELAEIGLIAWPTLDAIQRQLVLEQAERSVAFSEHEAKNMMKIANRTGMAIALCLVLESDVRARQKICA